MKRARPKNKKAAQRLMRQREIEYLKRQKEEPEETPEEEESILSTDDVLPEEEYSRGDILDNSAVVSEPEDDFDDIPEETDIAEEEAVSEPTEYDEQDDEAIDEYEDEDPSEAEADFEEDEQAFEEDEDFEDDAQTDEDESIEEFREERKPTDIDLDLPRKPRKKKNIAKRIFKVLVGTMIVLIALIFIALGFGFFDDTEILAPLEDGKINVLLMGVDESGLRADAVMVASYDVNEGKINMLSIPRDTKIYVKNRKVTRKMNEIHGIVSDDDPAYILGSQAVAEAVTTLTGIPVNYYVEFSFASIDHLFDILGPVEFDVPDIEGNGRGMNYDDPYQDLHIHLKPGLQKLSGNQVQQFLRYRKSNYGVGTGSDTDRVERQQEFVKAVIDQKVNLSTLLKLPNIFSQLSREIRTNISLNDVTKYIRHLNKLSGDGISTYSLPGEAKTLGGGSYFVCDLDATATLLKDTFGIDAEISDKVTLSETNTQKPLKVTYVTATKEPTEKPTKEPTKEPTDEPTDEPTKEPTEKPTDEPTKKPTQKPTDEPTKAPVVTKEPTKAPVVTKEPEDEIIILE